MEHGVGRRDTGRWGRGVLNVMHGCNQPGYFAAAPLGRQSAAATSERFDGARLGPTHGCYVALSLLCAFDVGVLPGGTYREVYFAAKCGRDQGGAIRQRGHASKKEG